jgi:filamentous hemagglutinin family protein
MKKQILPLLTTTALSLLPAIAQAQTYTPSNRTPQQDNSSGTIVNPAGVNNFNITGGLQRGQNLFHSFTDFSIPTGGAANFINPAGNQSIISRVTGNLFSDLNGTLNTNGANFLLINPNGVVFGSGVKLDVGKAFVASTASGVDFVDAAGRNYNFGVNKAGDAPLISIDPNVTFNPARLIMNASIPGRKGIENYGTLQTNNPGQYIGLIGGNVNFYSGKIIAPGGRVDLGGFNTAGTVSIDNRGLVFGGNGLIRGDISLSNGALVTVRANQTLEPINTLFDNASSPGSSINIVAKNLNVSNVGIKSNLGSAAIDAGLQINSGMKNLPTGDISIDTTGKFSLNNSDIKNTILSGAGGSIGNIKINANSGVEIANNSVISSETSGTGDGGKIDIKTQGNLAIIGTNNPSLLTGTGNNFDGRTPLSNIISSSSGQGNAGKITIDAKGKLTIVNRGGITSRIAQNAVGNGQGIKIDAKEIELANRSTISSGTLQSQSVDGKGNAGDVEITTKGDIKLSGFNPQLTKPNILDSATITTSTAGKGDTGKITIKTEGKLSIINKGGVVSSIAPIAIGNSNGIKIEAAELELINDSSILTNTLQTSGVKNKGKAGDIEITSKGNMTITGNRNMTIIGNRNNNVSGTISSSTYGKGDGGKITINVQGVLSITNRGQIFSTIAAKAIGNSKGIKITAGELKLSNESNIETATAQTTKTDLQGNAGDIEIITKGGLTIIGTSDISKLQGSDTSSLSSINSGTFGQGNGGKITLDVGGKLSVSNRGSIVSTIARNAIGNSKGIKIDASGMELANFSFISSQTFQSAQESGKGKAGDIAVKVKGNLQATNSSVISSSSIRQGEAGDIFIISDRLLLNNGGIFSEANSVSGGNINLSISDKLLLRNDSTIATDSGSLNRNGNGGNITINSPLIVATPGNNDITANANGGNGGNINITSQGLFGIQYRPKGTESSLFTNDITASSTFGQSGNVQINTPGVDPGKDTGELPAAPNDASRQISQTCSASQRDNKFYITGRGGLPPNASEPQESEALWQDAREVKHQPATTANQPAQLPPPAIGWVFEQNGRVRLIAAQTAGGVTGTRAICPNVRK